MTTHPKPKSALRICHINLRSFHQRKSALTNLIDDYHVDIFTFNETKFGPRSNPTLPGYSFIRKDHPMLGRRTIRGLAIAHKSTLDLRPIPIHNDPPDALMAVIKLPNQQPIHIATMYTNPFQDNHGDTMAALSVSHPNLIITGDFNSHHTAMGDRTTSMAGRILYQTVTAARLSHHMTPYTRFPEQVNHLPTCPDKIFTSHSLNNKISSITSAYDIGSDHIPLLIDIQVTPFRFTDEARPHITITDYKNADWPNFSQTITNSLSNLQNIAPLTPEEIDTLNARITKIILDAKGTSIPTKDVIQTKFRFPPNIIALIKQRRRVRRLILDDPSSPYLHDAYKAISKKIKYHIRIFHENRIGKMCDRADSNFSNSSKDFWRMVKRLNSTFHQPSPLLINDTLVTDNEGKAEAFRQSLIEIHSVPQHNTFDPLHFHLVNNLVLLQQPLLTHHSTLPENLPPHDLTSPITIPEITLRIKRLRNTAPGPEGISNLLLKKSPAILLQFLVTLFNSVLLMGYSPSAWKHSHVILIPKPHKNPRDPSSYRPISLTSPISKLFEKVLVTRLHTHLNHHNLLPNTQAGFRPGINMYDQLLRVVTCLQRNNSLHRPSILALMDVHKAFDTVWHNGLRAKLFSLLLPPSIIKWISNFLDHRTAQVRINGTLSTPFPINAGVPQGSAISPLLYLIYVRDIPSPIPAFPSDTSRGLAQFADDTAFWASSRKHDCLRRILTQSLSDYMAFCSKWRILINPSKTQLCYFNHSKRRFLEFSDNPIFLNGTRLTLKRTCTYLGVTLDTTLSFSNHVKKAKKISSSRFKALAILNNHHLGCSTKPLKSIYTSILRPVLTFAHPVTITITENLIKLLESSERRAMRLALHLHPATSNIDLYTLLDFPPLREFLNKLNTNYMGKAINSPIISPYFTPALLNVPSLSIHHLQQLIN